MGCSGSSSKDNEIKKKSNSYNLTVTYTHEETAPILSVAAKDQSTIVYGQKGVIKIFNAKTKVATEYSKEHTKRVDGIKFLSSGLLLTFGQEKAIKIWDITKPQSLMTFEGHESLIWDVIELKDGRLLSSGDDSKLLVWNIQTKQKEFALSEGTKDTYAYSAQLKNGQIAVTGGNSKKIMFWDLNAKKIIDSMDMDQGLWVLCLLKDDKLAIGCGNGEIRIFNPADKTISFTLKGDLGTCVHALKELESGWLLSTSESNSVYIWNLNSPGDKFILDSHSQPVTDACKVEDKIIVSVGKDKTLKIWS